MADAPFRLGVLNHSPGLLYLNRGSGEDVVYHLCNTESDLTTITGAINGKDWAYTLDSLRWWVYNSGWNAASGEPAGGIIGFGGTIAPAGWLLCDGTSYLRATYPSLFTAIGTAFGAADGLHFNVPPATGRALVGVNGATFLAIGTTVGEETHTLTVPESASHGHSVTGGAHTHTGPSHTHTGGTDSDNANHSHAITGPTGGQSADHVHNIYNEVASTAAAGAGATSSNGAITGSGLTSNDHTHTLPANTNTGNAIHSHTFTSGASGTGATGSSNVGGLSVTNSGGDGAHNNIQPSLAVNFIIKI